MINRGRQPSHCGKCTFFVEQVFEGETENGWGSWFGQCSIPRESKRFRTRSRYLGCEKGKLKPRPVDAHYKKEEVTDDHISHE